MNKPLTGKKKWLNTGCLILIWGFAAIALFNQGYEYFTENKNSRPYTESSSDQTVSSSNPKSGTYCAEVNYYNKSTGTRSTYYLKVEVYDDYLDLIYFPQGSLSNFDGDVSFEDDNLAEVWDENGYKYEVSLLSSNYQCEAYEDSLVQCRGITREGSRCRHLTTNSSGFCWQHE